MATYPIKNQGSIDNNAEVTIYKTPTGRRATVTLISISNTKNVNYTISLFRVVNNGDKKTRFSVSLNAGEFLEDSTNYILAAGDYFIASCTGGPLQYIVSGEEVDA